jgi:hypothetical protein
MKKKVSITTPPAAAVRPRLRPLIQRKGHLRYVPFERGGDPDGRYVLVAPTLVRRKKKKALAAPELVPTEYAIKQNATPVNFSVKLLSLGERPKWYVMMEGSPTPYLLVGRATPEEAMAAWKHTYQPDQS